jgi:predicted metal-dependent phosphoesterase TrpH
MIRIDLHTHSEASPDGGITPEEYANILRNEKMDIVAITDHDRIDFALGLQKALGSERIIVGEEITTTDGEIIGLYLKEQIKPGLSADETADAIHAQGGLVYIPHPFEKVRKGIQINILNFISDKVDIIEAHNGRSLNKKYSVKAETWAIKNKVAVASSSDAHGIAGVGYSYTTLADKVTRHNLVAELFNATIISGKPPYRSLLYPKYNRLKNKFKGF